MKKEALTLSKFTLALGLGLSLSITSCKDNDLADGGNHNGDKDYTELTDLEWQKQQSLQCLMGAVAGLDSLPQNWNDATFTANPTIGEAADGATPYSVRLVPTSSADEAYREFCSMTQSSMTSTATNQTWSQEGIGTMRFEVNNTPSLYATLHVNVQQLPTLQEIRFVPPTALGDNGDNNKEAYYSFGDIIEKTEGNQKTYWVCVRPVDVSKKLKTSHWCTLQLLPSNYKTLESKTLVLPTALCNNRSDGERMTQNFFNLLRSLADPTLYADESVAGLDKFTQEEFPWNQVRTTSHIWDLNSFWSKFMPEKYADCRNSEVKKLFTEPDELDAIYYGYTSKSSYFGQGETTYKVYNVHLTCNDEFNQTNRTLFNNVTPQTRNVNWEKDERNFVVNFNDFYSDPNRYVSKMEENQSFIVRYKTGAQLQERFLSTANDYEPEYSFTVSTPKAAINEIFVYKDKMSKGVRNKQNKFYPFFTLGDIVSKFYDERSKYQLDENEYHLCVLPALNNHNIASDDKNYSDLAYFINSKAQTTNVGVEVTEAQAKYLAKIIMAAKMDSYEAINILNGNRAYIDQTDEAMKALGKYLTSNAAIQFKEVGEKNNNNKDFHYKLTLNLYMNSNDLVDGVVKKPHILTLCYYPSHDEDKQYVYSITQAKANEATSVIALYTYYDTNMYAETYSSQRDLTLQTESARQNITTIASNLFIATQSH